MGRTPSARSRCSLRRAPTASFSSFRRSLVFGPRIAWGSIVQLPVVGVLSTCAFALTLVLVLLAVVCTTERALSRLDWAILLLAVVVLGTWAATELYFYPAYGTDEAAFVSGRRTENAARP